MSGEPEKAKVSEVGDDVDVQDGDTETNWVDLNSSAPSFLGKYAPGTDI